MTSRAVENWFPTSSGQPISLPPERFTGDVVEALSNAGIFRLRGVLVGTVAYQCYSGLLGVRLPSTAMQTGDADFAQFHSISAAIDDSLPPMLGLLKAIDSTFREIPHQTDSRFTTQYENSKKFKVEFITPNTGSDEHAGHATKMPALGGAAAQPLRFLDYLNLCGQCCCTKVESPLPFLPPRGLPSISSYLAHAVRLTALAIASVTRMSYKQAH